MYDGVANSIKQMCTGNFIFPILDAFLASRLVPLDKNPNSGAIGVGQVFRIIAGKIVISITKKDVVNAIYKENRYLRKMSL